MRPARRVDEQRPDPARLVGRGQPDHRHVEAALRRRRVVTREADLRTQEAVPAIAPSCGAHGKAGRAGWARRGTRGRVRRAWRDGHHGCRRRGRRRDGRAAAGHQEDHHEGSMSALRVAPPSHQARSIPDGSAAHPREGHGRGWDRPRRLPGRAAGPIDQRRSAARRPGASRTATSRPRRAAIRAPAGGSARSRRGARRWQARTLPGEHRRRRPRRRA